MAFAVEFLPVGDSAGDAILIQYGTESSWHLNLVDGDTPASARKWCSTSMSTTAAISSSSYGRVARRQRSCGGAY